MGLAERSFQLAELRRSEARPMSLLFDRFAAAARRRRRRRRRRGAGGRQRQRQRPGALVLGVLARRRRRRRRRRRGGHRTLVPGTLQHVLRRRTGCQVSHVRLAGQFTAATVLQAQRKTADDVVVIVVVAAAAADAAVVGAEVSLTVFVVIVQKHFDERRIRNSAAV